MNGLSISVEWEALDEGPPEERACFGSVAIQYGAVSLSEGYDPFVKRVRRAPLVSAYHLAEWLTWNWWRLRWEPRSRAADWALTHRLATIGSGYVWPNVTIFSDGERIAAVAKPSKDQDEAGYRYIADGAAILPAADFENAVDRFLEQVSGQLAAERVRGTNFERLRADLLEERQTPRLARYRKMEALLGFDPDEAPGDAVERLLADTGALGSSASSELAAESAGSGVVLHAAQLDAIVEQQGFEASRRDAFRLANRPVAARGQVPAWWIGRQAAREARAELGLGEKPIADRQLTKLLAVDPGVLADRRTAPISFALDEGDRRNVVLRSKWKTGRRFELARLLGDQIAGAYDGRLWPITRAFTYRQKMQRSFAAEFLSPFDAVDAMLDGDYSDEQQSEVAEHYKVSPLTIRTLLVNHRKIGRDDIEADVEMAPTRAAQQ